ncbi:putative zinc-finger [Frankia sp. EI5c]|uniref:anti-sigma factor family protein n=1 Tax=Frankia sp. EI5c TaxID=683316 RepID=UPI0007C2708B|nr:zf-HC2 domain-containing protein [Frankia sp. EI5c]OAA24171.1 putative zinc-finger [Frankia sp. EI5c]
MSGHLGERLTSLVDGQLGHDDRDRALAHLARCSACQAEAAEQRFLKTRLTNLAEPTLPGGLTASLLSLGAREYQAARPARPAPSAPLRMPVLAGGFVAERSAERAAERSAARRPAPAPEPLARRAGGREPHPALSAGSLGRGGAAPARPGPVRPAVGASRAPGGPSLRSGACGASPVGGKARGMSGARPGHSARSGGRGRMRRTLVGSAAFMMLAVSGSALADGRAAARPAGPQTGQLPAVVAAVPAKAPSPSGPRPSPMIAPVSFPRP